MSEVDEMLKSSNDTCLQLRALEGVPEQHRRIVVSEQSYVRALEILDRDTTPALGLVQLMRGKHEDEGDAGL
ncbi:hypothetical protein [Pseudomonas fluorescens]|uniref:hypothetical protein n=1 Tax=Pseudomonas fluorescens TaxID=294 RepID=UPI0012428174|nr:hypothetical protein [Pseudomonas fluorescens]